VKSREVILENLRRSLHRQPRDGAEGAVEARLLSPQRNIVPQRGQLEGEELLELFIRQATTVDATLARVSSDDEVPEAVADYLKQSNLPPRIRIAPHPDLQALPWSAKAPLLQVAEGRADPEDLVSVTPAFAGVAETGTLVLHSGAETPTTLNFLPETHVVILRASQVVGAYEEVWDLLRATYPQGLPRSVNMITGPSRTADIEQRLELGAHGPRRLHIVLIEDERSEHGQQSPQ